MWSAFIETLIEISTIVICGQIAISILEGSSFANYVRVFVELLILLEFTMAFCYCLGQLKENVVTLGGLRQEILQVGGMG